MDFTSSAICSGVTLESAKSMLALFKYPKSSLIIQLDEIFGSAPSETTLSKYIATSFSAVKTSAS
jgi:hypothetical protein